MMKILIVEDEESISRGLSDILSFHGFETEIADRGDTGLEKAKKGGHDLLLLDVMLPGVDGFEILDQVRSKDKSIPIIMLTALSDHDNRINGLSLGADDYIAKPYSTEELVLRIKAVLRRTNPYKATNEKFRFDNLVIDPLTARGLRGSELVEFTSREIQVLQYLLDNPGRPVKQEELLEKVWGYTKDCGVESRTVDVHIAKLRKKIENGDEVKFLKTVWGKGFLLEASS